MLPLAVSSRESFHLAWQAVLDEAIARRARVLTLVDRDFEGWRWDEPHILGALQAFVRLPQRSLRLVGERFDRIPQQAPRFAAWRRDWAHAVNPLWPAEPPSPWPCLVLADRGVLLRLEHRENWRGSAWSDDPAIALVAQQLETLAQQCEPAWPVQTVGL